MREVSRTWLRVFLYFFFSAPPVFAAEYPDWDVYRQDGNAMNLASNAIVWSEMAPTEKIVSETPLPQGQTFWLRTNLRLSDFMPRYNPSQDYALVLDLYAGSNLVYWDGKLIGETGAPRSSTPYNVRVRERVYFLSPARLAPGTHELVIAVFKPDGSERQIFHSAPKVKTYFHAKAMQGWAHFRTLDMTLIAAVILFWLGAYFYLFYSFHRQMQQYFFLAVIDFLVAAYIVLDTWKLPELGLDSLHLLKLTFSVGMWIIFFMQRFFCEMLQYKPGKLDRFTLLTTVFFSVCMLCSSDYFFVMWTAILWFPTLLVYLIYFGIRLYTSTGIPRKSDDIMAHLTYFAVICSISYDIYCFIMIGNVAAVSPFAFLFFSIGMGYRLAKNFGAALNDRRIQSDVLKKNKELEHAYQFDGLTKVYSRRYFEKIVQEEDALSRVEKEQTCIAVLDVDHFKMYNDTYGHLKGDRLLTSLGWVLNAWKSQADMVFRIGGEEFLVLMKGKTLDVCIRQCERLRQSVESFPFDYLQESGKHVTVSIGVAAFTSELNSMDELYKVADSRLYQAKQSRNTVYPEPKANNSELFTRKIS